MNKTLRINPHLMKVEHNKLTGRHRQNITAVFRAVEFVLFLAVISRLSLMLPLALKLSGDYFRDLAVTLVSPRFVFVVGNAIVITLFLKSGGKFSHRNHPPENSAAAAVAPPPPEKTTTFIVSVYSAPAGKSLPAPAPAEEVKVNCYRRSKSEKMCVRAVAERKCGGGGELRRTKTERMERRVCKGEYYPEDKMSGEEFRRTIEDFIARQQRFLREEEEQEDETLALAG